MNDSLITDEEFLFKMIRDMYHQEINLILVQWGDIKPHYGEYTERDRNNNIFSLKLSRMDYNYFFENLIEVKIV